MVKFAEEKHEYTDKNTKYLSVSKLIGKHKQYFDSKYWSLYKAIQGLVDPDEFRFYKKEYGKSFVYKLKKSLGTKLVNDEVKKLLAQWKAKNKKSTVRGHKFHNKKEDDSYAIGTEQNLFDMTTYKVFDKIRRPKVNESLAEDLYELEDGFYPELLLWNHDKRLAGQADRVFIGTDVTGRYIDIGDYKTNEKITASNFFQKMKGPLKHLDDCNYNHYCLQLSCYAWMLEQFGFRVRNLSFDHYKEGVGEPKRYNFQYLRSDVENMVATLPLK